MGASEFTSLASPTSRNGEGTLGWQGNGQEGVKPHIYSVEQMSQFGLVKGSWGRGEEEWERREKKMEVECSILNYLAREAKQDEGQL